MILLGAVVAAASKYPKVAAFLARMMARPSFAAALASDRAMLG